MAWLTVLRSNVPLSSEPAHLYECLIRTLQSEESVMTAINYRSDKADGLKIFIARPAR
jgi:hypothetical protein